jgi:miniconductance mechanosensitive channel
MIRMDIFAETPVFRNVVIMGTILLVTLLVRYSLFRFVPLLLTRQSPLWNDILAKYRVLNYLTLSVPGLLLAAFVQLTPDINPNLALIVYKLALIYSIIMLALAVVETLRAYNDFYDQYYKFAREVPIKTVVQTANVLIVIFAILVIIAILLGVPLLALASVIAFIAAVAAYLFREPMLGFAASLQLSMNHMLAIGDWIEIERYNADGEVEDINVTSTKVCNWDNSIVNVPTSTLIKESFQNWRMMQTREARRVLRPIYLDQTSFAFIPPEEKAQKIGQIAGQYENLPQEIKKNVGLQGVTPQDLNGRERLSNLELFMAHATYLVAGHPQTRADHNIYVRQQDPTPQGLPVEIVFSHAPRTLYPTTLCSVKSSATC